MQSGFITRIFLNELTAQIFTQFLKWPLEHKKNLYSIPILCVQLIIEGGKMKKKKISFKTVLIIYKLLHELWHSFRVHNKGAKKRERIFIELKLYDAYISKNFFALILDRFLTIESNNPAVLFQLRVVWVVWDYLNLN